MLLTPGLVQCFSSAPEDPCANEPMPHGKIQMKVALEPRWNGYSMCDPSTGPTDGTWMGTCEGIVQPVAAAVCEAAGLECTNVITEWNRIWDGNAGAGFLTAPPDFDAAAAAGITTERSAESMYYSNPYTKAATGHILSATGVPASPTTVKVCTVKGVAVGTTFIKAKIELGVVTGAGDSIFNSGNTIELVEAGNIPSAIDAVNNGDCHVLLGMGDISGGSLMTIETVEYTGDPSTGHSVGGNAFMLYGPSDRSACLVSKLNDGIDAVRASGELESIVAEGGMMAELDVVHEN
jgi:ABC-type amino acid transport substrate-binding protein